MNQHHHAFGYSNPHDELIVITHPVAEYRGVTYELINNHAIFSYPKMDEQLFGQLQSKFYLFRLRSGKYSVNHDGNCYIFEVVDYIFDYEAECKKYALGGEKYVEAVHKFEKLVV